MATKALPSVDVLRKIFQYDQETGLLCFLPRDQNIFDGKSVKENRNWEKWNKRFAGKSMVSTQQDGYILISIFGNYYFAHRIIWKMQTGKDPIGVIDHINGDRIDNRMFNLRDISLSENARNKHPKKHEKSKFAIQKKFKDLDRMMQKSKSRKPKTEHWSNHED